MRSWKQLVSPALPVVFLALPPVWADEAPAYINIHKPLTSTAMILVPDTNIRSQGSGFVVDYKARLLLTNYHVVGQESSLLAVFPTYEQAQARADRNYYLTKAPRFRGKVVHRDDKIDLALLELQEISNDAMELKLATDSAKVSDRIHTSGNPGNDTRAFVYTPGKVNEITRMKMEYVSNQKVECRILEIATDGKLSPGVSGGPVVNSQGELVGVIAAGPPDGSQRAMCIDIKEVRHFLCVAHRKLATAAIRKQEYSKAVEFCTRALEYNPGDALTLNERGVAYSYQDSYDKAIADYTAALKSDPKLSRAFRSRGSAYFHKGEFDKTVKDCTEALVIDPKYALAYLWRGKALAKLGKADEAAADRAKALKLDPSLQ
jgi:tetratricopeptide (TPR) repeat protein